MTRSAPAQRFSLTHDEAFDIDVTLQLKPILCILALLWPQDQPFSVTQTRPVNREITHVWMNRWVREQLIVFVSRNRFVIFFA